MFSKKVTDFLTENPEITMVSLGWSLYWRTALAFMLVYFAAIAVVALLIGLTNLLK